MSWFKWREKVKFYWQAKNAHGLHSPFVFKFYNAVKKQVKSKHFPFENLMGFSKKESRIILAIQKYFKPNQILVVATEEQELNNWTSFFSTESKVSTAKNLNQLPLKSIKFDLIILHNQLIINKKELDAKLFALISNDTTVIIPHNHASKNAISQWETLIEDKSVRVSLDLFFVGLLFFRKESTKQDFQLRF